MYVGLLAIMIPLRVYFHKVDRNSNSEKIHDLYVYITVAHFLMCTTIFTTFTIYLMGENGYATCTATPLRMLPYNIMIIWFTTMGPGLVLIVTIAFVVMCAPCLCYYGCKYCQEKRQAREMGQMVITGLVQRKWDSGHFKA